MKHKLIKEIAVDAGLLIKKSNGNEFRYGNFDPRFQKFAELIIKECVEKCKTDWYGDSLDDVCTQMLKHFGVES